MSRSTTPTYVVHMYTPGYATMIIAWRVRGSNGIKGDGQPTDANLAKYVASFERSTRKGGVNEHLGEMVVRRAWIKRQSTHTFVYQTVAAYFLDPT